MPHWDRADAVPEPAWPREIRVKDGTAFSLSAEYLRVESPSAEVQGHGPGQRQFVTGVTDVTIVAVEPVGNYAVRLCFSDGHDTGLYSWSYLYELGRDRAQRWQKYLDGLAKAGRAR
jgi:DUF971 family protein